MENEIAKSKLHEKYFEQLLAAYRKFGLHNATVPLQCLGNLLETGRPSKWKMKTRKPFCKHSSLQAVVLNIEVASWCCVFMFQ